MKTKQERFRERLLQTSFNQKLTPRREINSLFDALSDEDLDRLAQENVYFTITYSPSAIITLNNIPVLKSMKLVTFDANYLMIYLPEEIVGILLHEIGHAFNSDKEGIEAEFAADNFAAIKGYAKWIVSGLENGLKHKLPGFDASEVKMRIDKLKELRVSQ